MSTTAETIEQVLRFNKNPNSVQQVILDKLESALAGTDISDATSPFMFNLEAAATIGAATINSSEPITRKLYPKLALTPSDLYRHMSDIDYLGRFASPSNTTIQLLLPLDSLLANAYVVPNSTDLKVITIPRDTKITVADVTLGIYYPIRIEILHETDIQVMYDLTDSNPLQVLTATIISYNYVTLGETKYLSIDIPVDQFDTVSHVFPLDGVSDFRKSIVFSDNYYHTRAYTDKGNGVWTEIMTSHNDIVYDISKPTLLLAVVDNVLEVKVPDIYRTNGSVGNAIRVDVYSTLGPTTLDLGAIPPVNYQAVWTNLDRKQSTVESDVLNNINDLIIYGSELLTGGIAARSFEDLKEQVIYHTNSHVAPIRLNDIAIGLKPQGYIVQPLLDGVTNRVYLASKNLPLRNRLGSVSPVLSANVPVTIDPDVAGYSKSIIGNSRGRTTVSPNTKYIYDTQGIRVLTDEELTAIDVMSNTEVVGWLNSNRVMFSPFHYVIDHTTPVLNTRVYYLQDPTVVARTFVDSNPVYGVVTNSIQVELLDNSYRVSLNTKALIDAGDIIHCQLRYVNELLGVVNYINATGVLSGDSYNFTFDLDTTSDITISDEIELTSLNSIVGTLRSIFVPLTITVDLVYVVESVDVQGTGFDNIIIDSSFTNAVNGATHETVTLELGKRLEHLYTPNSTVLHEPNYVKYSEDVPTVYPEDVYGQGPFGTDYTIATDGSVDFTLLHRAGDTVIDSNGNVLMEHLAGDYVLDSNGNKIPELGSMTGTIYNVGITMVNGMYAYATSNDSSEYKDKLPKIIMGYLNNEIKPAATRLHERTELYYKPRGVLDTVEVNVGNGIVKHIDSELKLVIDFYLTAIGTRSPDVLGNINSAARAVMAKHIKLPTMSTAAVTKDLTDISSEITGIGIEIFTDSDIDVATLVDPTTSFSIPEIATVLPNGLIEVTDDIEINFKTYFKTY